MRANLLPRSPAKFGLFGLSLDGERLRQGLIALSWVAFMAASAAGVELLRLHQLEVELARQTAAVSANEARRGEVRNLAFDVAHLQDVRNAAALLRESGNDVALQIARVGNAIPPGVWLDRLVWDSRTVALGGESASIEIAGSTAALLERTFPNGRAVLTDVRRREDDRYVFAAELELRP